MDAYVWAIAAFLVFSLILIILVSRGDPDGETFSNASTIEELRSRQIKGLRELSLKRKFEGVIEDKAKNEKKYAQKEQLLRAGLSDWSYGELAITKVGLALLAVFVSWVFVGNIVVTGVSAFVFYLLPGQLISMIANRRIGVMEKDIGVFIQLTIERYKVHGDFQKAVKQSSEDFRGQEPIYSEITTTILDFDVGTPTAEAIKKMGTRTGNKFISQLANYYEIASTIGTEASRDKIIGQAWENYNEDYKMKRQHEQEIDGPKKDAFIIVAALPLMMVYQASVDETYVDFFLNTTMGQFGLAAILIVTILSIIFINKKIAAPIH